MKNVLLLLIFFASLFSCKKDEVDKTVNDSFDTAQAMLLSQGNFSSGAHATSGNVKLYSKNGSKFLVFDNFKTDSGPDLRVYLSKANNVISFFEVGGLKATNGSFYYSVDSIINTSEYNHVLIWCEDFSVLFGSTQLQ